MSIRKVLLLSSALLGISSCSSTSLLSQPGQPENLSFDLFISRSSVMNPVEYEQYSFKNGQMFQECGKIRRDKYFTEQQELEKFLGEEASVVSEKVASLVQTLDQYGNKFEKPASKQRFFDPGIARIKISYDEKKYLVETSLDSISGPTTNQERAALALVENVRKFSKTTCGNPLFFGITKAK